jgi:hypothetical protein
MQEWECECKAVGLRIAECGLWNGRRVVLGTVGGRRELRWQAGNGRFALSGWPVEDAGGPSPGADVRRGAFEKGGKVGRIG